MQLLNLTTENFKRLRQHRFDFQAGLNVIVGDNAAGKTTLLQAIECALYGAGVVPGKKEHITTWAQKSWRVELAFAIGDDVYELTRSKSTAKLVHVEGGKHGDALIANGHTPVTLAITELLDLSAKDYSLFIQSKQGETTGILTFGAAALNRKVEEFAGISVIDRVQSLAQEQARTQKAECEALAVDPEALDAQGEACLDAEGALKAARTTRDSAQQVLDALPALDSLQPPLQNPDTLQARLEQRQRLASRVERSEVELTHAQQRLDEARQRAEDLDEPQAPEALAVQLKDVNDKARAAGVVVERCQRELNLQEDLWEQLAQAEQRLAADPPEATLRETLAEAETRRDELSTQFEDAHRAMVELSQQIQQRQGLAKDATCPTCGTKLTEHDPAQLTREIEDLKDRRIHHESQEGVLGSELSQCDRRIREQQVALAQALADQRRVDELRDTLIGKGVDLSTAESPIEGELASAREVHEGLVADKAKLSERVERSEAEWTRYRRAQQALATERAQAKDALDQHAEAQRLLRTLDAEGCPTPAYLASLRKAWATYETLFNDLKVERLEATHAVQSACSAFHSAEQALSRAEQALDSLRARKAQAQAVATQADQAARLSRFLGERRAGYLQEVWDAVLSAASKQVAMASQGMISRLVYDDGDFLFEEEGVLAPVAAASGAQKAHIGVALRIGLSRALYGSQALIIFDEPTESMSEHHASGLSASLAGAASQCLLITHREQDQDLAANVLEVSE